ncbi:hypothetical protein QTG54_008756 [Skeletonema marinoi]|uniref:Uncharacterized protein n=1 Tax=Skeletonema marinoi TaxID=267567 RepID=A0AAD8Y6J3_9STRA|nr:hypothetical protein QTG54_008756 [Skeletonema marinoi]
MPKRKRKFNRDNNKRHRSTKQRREQRSGAAADNVDAPVDAPAEENGADVQPAAIATPTPTKRIQQPSLCPSHKVRNAEKKAEGFFNECVKVQNQLNEEKIKTEQLKQELQQLRQQLIDDKNMHEDKAEELKDLLSSEKTAYEKEVNKLKDLLSSGKIAREKEVNELEEQIVMAKSAREKDIEDTNHTHKLKTDKLNNLLQSQQQRYKTKLSSTIDDANKKLEEANELKLEAQETIRAAHKDAERVIVNERNHSTHLQKRLKEKHKTELVALIKSTTTNKRRNNNGEIDEEIVDEEVDDELVDEEVEAVDNTLEREREREQQKKIVDELKAKVKALEQIAPKVIQKKWIKNPNGKKGGTQAWPHHVVLLIMEWLSNRTPPSCIAANIVSLCSIIMPSADIALELPTTPYIRTVRSLLVVVTKTLAAYTVARVPRFHQIYTDGTTRRQTELINMLIGYVTDEGLKTVTLDNMIISPEKKSLSTAQALMQSMENAQKLLKGWREVTKELYPMTRTFWH